VSGSRARFGRVVGPALCALVGLALVAWVVSRSGLAALRDVAVLAAPYLPLLFAIEAGRELLEVFAAQALYPAGKAPAFKALLRVHLLTYGVLTFAPAGRATAEALRAGLLAGEVGGARAAAAGTAAQGLVMLSTAVASAACAVGALLVGARTLAGPLWLQALVFVGIAMLLLLAPRSPLAASLVRRVRKATSHGEDYVRAMRELPAVPWRGLAWLVASRATQLVLVAVALHAVGAGVTTVTALVAHGALLVGTSAGDLVPGQLGATDGAFAFFHGAIGCSEVQAVGVALLLHAVQLGWTLATVPALLVVRRGAAPAPHASVSVTREARA
jgi:hypothetical protein